MELIINSKTHGKCIILFDNKDYAIISKHKWAIKNGSRSGKVLYASTHINRKGKRTTITMHKLILKNIKQIDHRNRNGLDNRRKNLRKAINGQNQMNVDIHKNNTSGYKGVHWNKIEKKYQVYITCNKKVIYLGLFTKAIDGGCAYNRAALKYHGEFAKLNPIN